MTEDEMDISRSTPGYRFDVRSAAAPAAEETAELDADAAAFVEQVTHDAEQPVVMFALEWCEFCWSVRKLFKKLGIPYHSVDLDSVAYQENDRGGKIRAVLKEQYGVATVPQIFVAGEHLGGATDFFAALKDGSLEPKMAGAGLDMQTLEEDFEPESLLPGWLHQR
ncbi:MAG: glutaredoxin domain-containing protein [Lysobacterales bacterium]